MNFIRLTAFIAVSMTFFACEQNKEAKHSSAEIPADQKEIAVKTITGEKSEFEQGFGSDSISRQKLPGDKEQQQQPGQPPVKQDWDKKIIMTASLNIETKDYNAYSISLRKK